MTLCVVIKLFSNFFLEKFKKRSVFYSIQGLTDRYNRYFFLPSAKVLLAAGLVKSIRRK